MTYNKYSIRSISNSYCKQQFSDIDWSLLKGRYSNRTTYSLDRSHHATQALQSYWWLSLQPTRQSLNRSCSIFFLGWTLAWTTCLGMLWAMSLLIGTNYRPVLSPLKMLATLLWLGFICGLSLPQPQKKPAMYMYIVSDNHFSKEKTIESCNSRTCWVRINSWLVPDVFITVKQTFCRISHSYLGWNSEIRIC